MDNNLREVPAPAGGFALPLFDKIDKVDMGPLAESVQLNCRRNLLDLLECDGTTGPASRRSSEVERVGEKVSVSGTAPLLSSPFRRDDTTIENQMNGGVLGRSDQTSAAVLSARRPRGGSKSIQSENQSEPQISGAVPSVGMRALPGTALFDGRAAGKLPDFAATVGLTPIDRAQLKQTAIGRLDAQILAVRPDVPGKAAEIRPVHEIREDILQLVNKAGGDASIKGHMEAFEKRCRERGLPEQEVSKTYQEVKRVLESAEVAKNCSPVKLAREILRNAADPTRIDQGQHPTCNVTSYECKLYAQSPAEAARLVASVATTGQFTCADGTVITLNSIKPDAEAGAANVPDGSRNYASQLFQLTAINIYWNRCEYLPDLTYAGRGKIRYCKSDEKGEDYLLDCSKQPPKVFQFSIDINTGSDNSPRIGQPEISEIHEQIIGSKAKDLGIERGLYTRDRDGTQVVGTIEDFKSTLSRIKSENGFPVLLTVNASAKPFTNEDKGEKVSPHLVTITDYDEERGLVAVDNQWGSGNDFTGKPGQKPLVTVDQLYIAMNVARADVFADLSKLMKKNLSETTAADVGKIALAGMTTGLACKAFAGATDYPIQHALWRAGYKHEISLAQSAYDFTLTKGGARTLRYGSVLGATALACAFNDVPGAYGRSVEEGTGKLTRALGQGLSYECGYVMGAGLTGAALKWAPKSIAGGGKIGLGIAAGIALATVVDRSLGEFMELGGRLGPRGIKYLINGK